MMEPLVQTSVVAIAIHAAAAGIAFYLWTGDRSERFLQFWALAWTAGLVRWLLHYPAESNQTLRAVEIVFISVTMFFMVLGSYDMLPGKPWRQRFVVAATGIVLVGYAVAAVAIGPPLVKGYTLFAAVLAMSGTCMWVAYRATRISGYALAMATLLLELVVVVVLLVEQGSEIANSVIVPLYNIPLMLSIVVVAHQRQRRQLRELYARLAKAEDDERRTLHAELHDHIGANLFALRLELDVAASLVERGDGAGAGRHLSGARDVADETVAIARDFMAELRPPALDDLGLVAALRTFAQSHTSRYNVMIEVVGDDLAPRPSPLVENALFRIAHEAVTNAARHGSPKHIAVAVGRQDGRLRLTVQDDGRGFDPGKRAAGSAHWGIRSMRERAWAIGGAFRIEGKPGEGTRVTVVAPWSAP